MKNITKMKANMSWLDREFSITQPDKVVELKPKTGGLGTDRLCEAESLSSASRGGNFVMLFSNEVTGNHSTLNGLGANLAQIVSKFLTENDDSISIADIVYYCIKMITDVKTGNTLKQS